jgi:hypothetical protein
MTRRNVEGCLGIAAVSVFLRRLGASSQSDLAAPPPPGFIGQNAWAAWPPEIGGVRPGRDKFTRLALRELVVSSPPFLVNHAIRTFYFGALIGCARGLTFDPNLLFLSCALHDLGLTETHMGPLPFELQGAEAAKRLLGQAGLRNKKLDVVWDGIAMHPHALAEFKRPEVALVALGASADVLGAGLHELHPAHVADTLAGFPRLEFKSAFVRSCAQIAERFPKGARRTFMRDIGERKVTSFDPDNICDLIERAPFEC